MNHKALAAALRIREQMQDRIRTHEWRPVVKLWGYKRTAEEQRLLAERLHAMQAAGMKRRDMIAQTNCSSDTLVKVLGRVRCR